MKKIVRLTENQLHRLIEQALNELDIRTKANAANKAASDWGYYNDMYNNNPIPFKREYAKHMAKRRSRQEDAFRDSISKDMGDERDAIFWPHLSHNEDRGFMFLRTPVFYNSEGEEPFIDDEKKWKLRDSMAEYLKGNSYYDKEQGKWLNPNDEGYDAEKSEPWAEIRKRKNPNESLARKVTESIITKLRRV